MPGIDPDLLAQVDAYLSETLSPELGVVQSRHLKEQLAEETPIVLVDVRQPEEFAQGHLEGAGNIPLRDLFKHLGEIPRDSRVVVWAAAATARPWPRPPGNGRLSRRGKPGWRAGVLHFVQAADAAMESTLNAYLQALPAGDGSDLPRRPGRIERLSGGRPPA